MKNYINQNLDDVGEAAGKLGLQTQGNKGKERKIKMTMSRNK